MSTGQTSGGGFPDDPLLRRLVWVRRGVLVVLFTLLHFMAFAYAALLAGGLETKKALLGPAGHLAQHLVFGVSWVLSFPLCWIALLLERYVIARFLVALLVTGNSVLWGVALSLLFRRFVARRRRTRLARQRNGETG